jgi:hypothetical protein
MGRSRLGPLAVEAKLGDPSRSSVWRAVHIEQRRALAVKIFPLPFGGTPEVRQEFAREWETLKRLRHGSIARCYGGGIEGDQAYLAYEIIDGESLWDRVQRRERLPWETVLDEAESLAEAIAYAHDRQVIHGNLVPDKIRTAGLAPAVLDFRVDRFRSALKNGQPPSPFELCFRAPEVLEDTKQVSVKSDLYSLGALWFYSLSGQTPLGPVDAFKTATEVTRAAVEVVPPKVASLVMDCPIWFSSLIEQLLEKHPYARPHSAAAVVLALREVRKRAAERIGVAQHATSGFSPLRVDVDKDEAMKLLGRHIVEEQEESAGDGAAFYERAWFLGAALIVLVGIVAWFLWPLNEAQLRERAVSLIAKGDRTSLGQAKDLYLQRIAREYPGGENAIWAEEQIDQIEMLEAERVLELKLSRGTRLSNEGERLYAAARQYEQFGDAATALDKYVSLETLLGDETKHRPFVNLARRQIAKLRASGGKVNEGQRIVADKLAEADKLMAKGLAMEARKIWYSVIELYQGNLQMEPLVATAQSRLSKSESSDIPKPENSTPPGERSGSAGGTLDDE